MLAVAHDFVVMREDRGYWCLPEVDLGLPLTAAMHAVVDGQAAAVSAHEAMMTGRRYTAPEALEAGIVHRTASEADVLDARGGLGRAVRGEESGRDRSAQDAELWRRARPVPDDGSERWLFGRPLALSLGVEFTPTAGFEGIRPIIDRDRGVVRDVVAPSVDARHGPGLRSSTVYCRLPLCAVGRLRRIWAIGARTVDLCVARCLPRLSVV